MSERLPVEVVVPLRWARPEPPAPVNGDVGRLGEFAAYLDNLASLAHVTVVDGSAPSLVRSHTEAFGPRVRVLTPQGSGLNGKVVGSLTGIHAARHELVVLADDDVRYDPESLRAVVDALQNADVVRPQNVFISWPWHARWDTGRTLMARSVGADWPGTFGLRASAVRAMGGWDADVLFENLEMVRTAQANGLRVSNRPDIIVPRVVPSLRHFSGQRLRQAYDSWAQPGRLVAELAIVPLTVVLAVRRRRRRGLVLLAGAVVAGAVTGRQRYRPLPTPWDVPAWSLAWLVERGVLSWCTVVVRLRGGVRYHGRRVTRAAHRPGQLAPRWVNLHGSRWPWSRVAVEPSIKAGVRSAVRELGPPGKV